METDEIERIKDLLRPIFQGSQTKQAILFGSVSRGSQTKKSDLDLLIVAQTEKRFFERYEAYEKIHLVIPDKSIDMLIYTPKELINISHRPFIRRILKEGAVIYES